MRLEGRVAAITGAASGFGAAAARRFVREGARVVLGDIQEDPGRALAEELGEHAVFAPCDVTRESEVEALVELAVASFGRLDVMYNNAGIVGAVGPIVTAEAEEWKSTLDIHLNGTFYGCKHAARVMIPQASGSIVNTASTAGLLGGMGPHAYAAAKHAIIGLTKNLSAELGHHGIRVNAIAPAGMATPLVAGIGGDPTAIEAAKKQLASVSPLKDRAGVAEDVANAALWLASDEAGYTSGLILTTDAGISIGASSSMPAFSQGERGYLREAGKRGM